MAGSVPGADESQRGIRAWKRDWISYEQYQVVHQSHMDALVNEGIVIRDTLAFVESIGGDGSVVRVSLRGHIFCSDGVVIRVQKWLWVRRGRRNKIEVMSEHYQYHAWVRARAGVPRRNLLRYDDAHADNLHRHYFNASGLEIETRDVDRTSMPRLDAVIREAVALASR